VFLPHDGGKRILFFFLFEGFSMSVTVGQAAPDFVLKHKAADGVKDVKLSEQRGSNVVLLFFPLAFTSVCTDELCSVSNGLELYAGMNAKVFGISVDSPFTLEVFAEKNDIKVPLLSDFNKSAATAFGAIYEVMLPGMLDLNGVAKRSAFVVDKDGVVRYAEVLDDARNLPNFEAIKSTLQALN
jgi:glutaredoxin-dependent peroxiredoxin